MFQFPNPAGENCPELWLPLQANSFGAFFNLRKAHNQKVVRPEMFPETKLQRANRL